LVPINPIYGWRTRETMSSPGSWYAANAKAGWGLLVLGGWLVGLTYLNPGWRTDARTLLSDVYLVMPLLLAGAALPALARRRRQSRRS
jgi:hypothetical protein